MIKQKIDIELLEIMDNKYNNYLNYYEILFSNIDIKNKRKIFIARHIKTNTFHGIYLKNNYRLIDKYIYVTTNYYRTEINEMNFENEVRSFMEHCINEKFDSVIQCGKTIPIEKYKDENYYIQKSNRLKELNKNIAM